MQAAGLIANGITCRRGDRLLFGRLDLRLEPGDAVEYGQELVVIEFATASAPAPEA